MIVAKVRVFKNGEQIVEHGMERLEEMFTFAENIVNSMPVTEADQHSVEFENVRSGETFAAPLVDFIVAIAQIALGQMVVNN